MAVEKARPIRDTARMRRDEAIAKLKQTEPALRGFGVAALHLFGSHARDEAGPDSEAAHPGMTVENPGLRFAPSGLRLHQDRRAGGNG
jgi:hypothetical protein